MVQPLAQIPTTELQLELIKRGEELPLVAPPPVTPTLDLEQIYTAIRLLDSEADVHVIVDETLAAGYSGWMELPLPADRICCQRCGLEWGDPVVKLKWCIDTKDRVACNLHTVSPFPAVFQFSKYWVKRSVLYLYRENTDTVNAAEYHVSLLAVQPLGSDWAKWAAKMQTHAEKLLG